MEISGWDQAIFSGMEKTQCEKKVSQSANFLHEIRAKLGQWADEEITADAKIGGGNEFVFSGLGFWILSSFSGSSPFLNSIENLATNNNDNEEIPLIENPLRFSTRSEESF